MVDGIGRNLQEQLIKLIISVIIVSTLFGGFVVWGIPKLWQIVKPFIHSITG